MLGSVVVLAEPCVAQDVRDEANVELISARCQNIIASIRHLFMQVAAQLGAFRGHGVKYVFVVFCSRVFPSLAVVVSVGCRARIL
jgi:hypothetical protein